MSDWSDWDSIEGAQQEADRADAERLNAASAPPRLTVESVDSQDAARQAEAPRSVAERASIPPDASPPVLGPPATITPLPPSAPVVRERAIARARLAVIEFILASRAKQP